MPAFKPLPLAAAALALIGGAGMVLAGASPWLALAIVVLWLGTLWLNAAEPEIAPEPVDRADVSRGAIHETLAPLGRPVLLLEGGRIVDANRAARQALGDHIGGQDARIALRHPDAMALIDAADGASVTIPGFTGARSVWELTRRNIGPDRWLIELDDRTAESDVSRAHTDFVANASHELRTPLAAIIGYAETLKDDAAIDAATRHRFVGIIEREAQRMLSLVEDLMTLSHVEAEKHDRPREPLDLGSLAARVVSEVATLQGKERVELAAAEPGLTVRGDATQLEQLLRNLIDNALKYGAPDTPVSVSVGTAEAGHAILAVRDRGPGIAPEHLPHLTRRFYRTDPGRSRASGGTGLGLAIVKHIAERHHGELAIASTLGEGTTVSLTLPLRKG